MKHVLCASSLWRVLLRLATLGSHLFQDKLSSTEQISEFVPELFPHQAVNYGVQAAVGVRQADGEREHVRVRDVVGSVPVGNVEFDQHAPQGDGLVGHPAQEEGQHDDGDGFGQAGFALAVAGFHAPFPDETQQHQVADGHDWHRHDESHQDFLDVVKG